MTAMDKLLNNVENIIIGTSFNLRTTIDPKLSVFPNSFPIATFRVIDKKLAVSDAI